MSPRKPPIHGRELGYGKPPPHSRFKPGQSGNPKGRPKGSKNFSTIFNAILRKSVSLRTGERVKRVTNYEALVRRLVLAGHKGDHKAIANALAEARSLDQKADRRPLDDDLNDQYRDILDDFAARIIADHEAEKIEAQNHSSKNDDNEQE